MSHSQHQPNTLCSVDPRSAGFAVVPVNTDQTYNNQPRMPHYPGRVRGICIRVKLRHDICRDLPAPIFSDTNRACKSGQPIESSRGFGHHVLRDTGAVHEVIWYCHTVGVMYAAPVFLLPVDSMGIHSPKKLSPLEPGLQCQPIIFWVGGAGPINLRPVFYTPAPSNRRDDSGGLFPRTASVQSGGSFHKLLFGLIDPTSGLAATSHPAARFRPLHTQSGADIIHANRLSDDPCGSYYDNHSRPRLLSDHITGAFSFVNSSSVMLRLFSFSENAPVSHKSQCPACVGIRKDVFGSDFFCSGLSTTESLLKFWQGARDSSQGEPGRLLSQHIRTGGAVLKSGMFCDEAQRRSVHLFDHNPKPILAYSSSNPKPAPREHRRNQNQIRAGAKRLITFSPFSTAKKSFEGR